MNNIEGSHTPEGAPRDISKEYFDLKYGDGYEFGKWDEFLAGLKDELAICVTLDLSKISDEKEFESKANALKAFIEGARGAQERSATIRATHEQHSNWAANAFNSGVQWEAVE